MGSDINEIALHAPLRKQISVGAESYAYHPGGKQRLTERLVEMAFRAEDSDAP